jgi:5-methylcytosine-specific restriction endonuclease McrA
VKTSKEKLAYIKAWQAANPERVQASRQRQAEKDRARARAYYYANRDKVKANSKAWKEANPERFKEHMKNRSLDKAQDSERSRRRQACKQQRTPKWLTKEDFIQIYQRCDEVTKMTGIQHQVDHIVPLRGKTVSGLHVPWNLEVIPAIDNQKKGNRLPPEHRLVGHQ